MLDLISAVKLQARYYRDSGLFFSPPSAKSGPAPPFFRSASQQKILNSNVKEATELRKNKEAQEPK